MSSIYYPSRIALDATHVYVSSWSGGVFRAPLSGGSSLQVATQPAGTSGIAVDATNVFFTNSLNDSVSYAAKSGGQATVVAGGQAACENVEVDAATIYFTPRNGGALYSVPRGQLATPTALVSLHSPRGMVIDATEVFVVGAFELKKVNKNGSNATVLASGLLRGWGLAADATHLFYTDEQAGKVWSVAKVGGQPRLLAQLQFGPRYIAVDATHVYWTNYGGGTVMRVAKP